MKPWMIMLSTMAAAAGVGWIRQATLSELKRENAKLENIVPATYQSRPDRPRRASFPESAKEKIRATARHLRSLERSEDPEAALEAHALRGLLLEQLAAADHQTVLKLIAEASSGMDDAGKTALMRNFVRGLTLVRPGEALMLLESLPEYEGKAADMRGAFLRCLPADPSLVVRAFERLEAYHSPAMQDREIVKVFFRAQARVEPEIAVARLLSSRGIELLPDLGGLNLGDELRNPQEHHAFLSALRTEGPKFHGSARLESVRGAYVGSLRQKMADWPSEDALRVVKTEFTPEEQRQHVYTLHAPDDPERWADWVVKMDWDDKLNHPIGSFIRNWGTADPAGARAWLDQQPDGPVRNNAINNFALQLSSRRPAAAAEAAIQLPPGRNRSHALKVISKSWKEQDPAAYAAFATRNGLTP